MQNNVHAEGREGGGHTCRYAVVNEEPVHQQVNGEAQHLKPTTHLSGEEGLREKIHLGTKYMIISGDGSRPRIE